MAIDTTKLPSLAFFPYFAADTETDGLQYRINKPFSFSISTPRFSGEPGSDYYFDQREFPKCWEWLRDQLLDCEKMRTKIIFHNAPFDVMMLDEVGVKVPYHLVEDTQLLACLINEHEFSYSLDNLAKKYIKKEKYGDIYKDLAGIFGGVATQNVQMKNLHRAPPSVVAPYAKQDTRVALELWEWQQVEIERQDLHQIVAFERRVTPHVLKAMLRGVRVDVEGAKAAKHRVDQMSEELKREIFSMIGYEFNIGSAKDMAKVFQPKKVGDGWVTFDGSPIASTPKGAPSFSADALRAMSHPAAKLIVKARKLDRMSGTFLAGHVIGSAVGGRVYPHINQGKGESERGGMEGTGTGRFSYTGPALQQISKRDKDLCELLRDLFLPDEGCLWSSRDWAQTDFRFMAHYTQAPMLLKAYENNPLADFHQVCADLTGVPRDAPHSGGANAKQINLGLVFGMGEGKLASQMGLPYYEEMTRFKGESVDRLIKKAGPEAKKIFESYHGMIPEIKDFLKRAKEVAEKRGYVKSMFGRHLRFFRGEKSYKAGGLIFQAATADLCKDRFVKVSEYLETVNGSVILSVHDELNNNIPNGDPRIDREVCAIMQDSSMYRVPLRTSAGMGTTWWNAMCNEKKEG